MSVLCNTLYFALFLCRKIKHGYYENEKLFLSFKPIWLLVDEYHSCRFNILVVNTEIVLSVNDRPFIKPQGAGQEPRSIPMDVPFSAFLMMIIPLTWSSINL